MVSVSGRRGSRSVSPKPLRRSSTGAGAGAGAGAGGAGGGSLGGAAPSPDRPGASLRAMGSAGGSLFPAPGVVTETAFGASADAGAVAEARALRGGAGGLATSAGAGRSAPTISASASADPDGAARPMSGVVGPEAISRSEPTLPSPPPEATAPEASSRTSGAMSDAPAARASWMVHVRTSPTRQW